MKVKIIVLLLHHYASKRLFNMETHMYFSVHDYKAYNFQRSMAPSSVEYTYSMLNIV